MSGKFKGIIKGIKYDVWNWSKNMVLLLENEQKIVYSFYLGLKKKKMYFWVWRQFRTTKYLEFVN